MSSDSVQRAIKEIRSGRMVILVDDEARENEGDFCLAAEAATPEAINFMSRFGRGLICLALAEEKINALDLPMMVDVNTSRFETAFTVSIDAASGITTGISASDRATTIKAAIKAEAKPSDLVRPGHVFPLKARSGGVLVRTGQTEGAVDLTRLAGMSPAGVICEIMNEDGTMARMPDLEVIASTHHLQILSIADLIEYRLAHESLVRLLTTRQVHHPAWGPVTFHVYGTTLDHQQHLVVVKGDLTTSDAPLVRVHAGFTLADVFDDFLSGGRSSLTSAMTQIKEAGQGVLVCLEQGERVMPLAHRLAHLGSERAAQTTSEPSGVWREIGIGAQILRDLGLRNIHVLSDNPRRLPALEAYGLNVVSVVPLAATGHAAAQPPKLEVVGG
jgi:3,4-dihydroxy 2-butanone 4-phosphate synthase/GTP cyclohydrolase II